MCIGDPHLASLFAALGGMAVGCLLIPFVVRIVDFSFDRGWL